MKRFSLLMSHPQNLLLALALCLAPLISSCARADQVLPASSPSAAATQTAPRALWVWNAGVITQDEARAQLFQLCREKNISILYLHLGDFLSDKKREAGDPKHVLDKALGDFLEAAHARNLRIEALDGDPSWARATEHKKALRRLQLTLDYNRTAPAARRLDGFQWDIEPYVLKEFRDEAQHDAVLSEFLDIVKSSRDMVQNAKVSGEFWLGFALPFWMDSDAQSINWNGATRPAIFQVIETLKTLPHTYIALMAYRDKAEGEGGSIAAVRGEVEYAAQHAPNVQIVVGQETGAVKGDPPSITFYEEGEGPLETALGQINAAYAAAPAYGGVAIHHLDSYRDLIARLPQTANAPQAATGEVALQISSPAEGAAVGVKADVSGQASGGASVQISVMPAGDIWYDGAPFALGADGNWSTPARIGNDKTTAGKRFTIRARLLDAAGKVLQEKQVHVTRK